MTTNILTSLNIYQSSFTPEPTFFPKSRIPVKDRWSMIVSNKLRRYLKGIFAPKNNYWIPELQKGNDKQEIKTDLLPDSGEQFQKSEKISTKDCFPELFPLKLLPSREVIPTSIEESKLPNFSLSYEFLLSD